MSKKRTETKAPASKQRGAPAATSAWQGYFTFGAIRETVESIVVAFILAFLFRTFEAEAFVIPTGSMAPTLMGAHKDVLCPNCNYRYRAGASSEAEDVAQQRGIHGPITPISDVTCPMCRLTLDVDPNTAEGRAFPTFGGDRILVSKFNFEFTEPRRWDVTVFKYPGEAQTNYIKRLVGLPGETLRLFHGDLYVKPAGDKEFKLERRPPAKLLAMAQRVYDNDYLVDAMTEKGWPLRWQQWPASAGEGATWKSDDGGRSFAIEASAGEPRWLGYRHFAPSLDDWNLLKQGRLPEGFTPRPRLITDFYAYNTSVQRDAPVAQAQMLGYHWVGDLMLDCRLEVTSAEGKAIFVLVEGGKQFRCELDCKTGEAQLKIDGLEGFQPEAQTKVRGTGSHRVAFANFDQQLLLWIDGSLVTFDAPTTYPPLGNTRPVASDEEPGDLLPARVGAQGAGLRVTNLLLKRDIYYIAAQNGGPVSDYDYPYAPLLNMTYNDLVNFWSTPAAWSASPNPFDQRHEAVFPLDADHFFVLGDNSPLSQDARIWPAERYVARELLVGKALYIFWPHSFNQVPGTSIPFPFFPNFARMGFIR